MQTIKIPSWLAALLIVLVAAIVVGIVNARKGDQS